MDGGSGVEQHRFRSLSRPHSLSLSLSLSLSPMLRTGERSQNQKQQRQMTLTTMQTGQNCCAQLNNSSTTLVASASETSERVRKKSKTLIFGEGKKGEEISHKLG